jgi:lipopolysaccharide/colanic/teichoic acid biosynthesis glycosyltransferase
MVKRFFDVVISAIGLLLLSPFFLLLVVVIKLDSPGPVFYRGMRIGRHGRPFKIYKFRSMVADAERKGPASTSTTDLRVTRSGHFIRKFKFDEVSQLINVFLGDMSIVGPRPEVKKFVEKYTEEEKQILSVRPGITDWSSIKYHNEGEIIKASGMPDADDAYEKLIRPEKIRLQLKYVKERNLWVDIKIVISTVLTLFSTRLGGRPIGVPE